jgi:tRNA 2-thiouridine synthesizing protein E
MLRELDLSGSAITRLPSTLGDIELERVLATGCDLSHAPYAMRGLLRLSGAASLPLSYSIAELEGTELEQENFLVNLPDWSPTIAAGLAAREDIELTPEHWPVIELLRQFYDDYQFPPAFRLFTKLMCESLGPDKCSSTYLLELFPKGLHWQAAKIAGLPRPTG